MFKKRTFSVDCFEVPFGTRSKRLWAKRRVLSLIGTEFFFKSTSREAAEGERFAAQVHTRPKENESIIQYKTWLTSNWFWQMAEPPRLGNDAQTHFFYDFAFEISGDHTRATDTLSAIAKLTFRDVSSAQHTHHEQQNTLCTFKHTLEIRTNWSHAMIWILGAWNILVPQLPTFSTHVPWPHVQSFEICGCVIEVAQWWIMILAPSQATSRLAPVEEGKGKRWCR